MDVTEESDAQEHSQRPEPRRTWVFPVVVLVVVLILGMCKLSASSVALYETDTVDTGVIIGRARPIRSDEWWIRLSSVVRQDANDYAGTTQLGIGSHDTGTLADLPAKNLDVLIRPQSLFYFVLPIEMAYATEWWFALALPIIGFFLLFVHFGLRRWPAALTASILGLSPVTQWWTNPDHGIIIGYSALGTVLLLRALNESNRLRRILLSAAGGWMFACAAASMYIPHLLQVYVLMIGIYVAAVIIATRELQSAKARAALNAGVAIGIGAAFMGVFYLRHRAAISAISSSVYPGRRSVDGGGGNLVSLLGAPYNRAVATPLTPTANGLNASEFSSGLFLWWPAVMVAGATFRRSAVRSTWIVLAVLTTIVGLYLAWFSLPIPKVFAQLTLFDTVPGHRMQLGVAVGGVLAFGLALRLLQNSPLTSARIALIAGSFYLLTVLAGSQLIIDDRPLSSGAVFFLPIPVTIGIALALGRRATLGLGIVVVFLAWASAYVNPLQYGLSPLLDHPVRAALVELHRENPKAAALLMDVDAPVLGAASSSGIPTVGGTNFYPLSSAWQVFDPTSANEEIWNRYATVLIVRGADQPSGTMNLIRADAIVLSLSPCDERLKAFHVEFVVTQGLLTDSCVFAVESIPAGSVVITIYRII